jgi:PAS domain S-box-containing protein
LRYRRRVPGTPSPGGIPRREVRVAEADEAGGSSAPSGGVTPPPGRGVDALFVDVVAHLPMGVHLYRLDPGGRLVFAGANPAADRILNVDNRRFLGLTIEEAFPPLAATEIPARYRRAAAEGEPWETEQVVYHDGQIAGAFMVKAFQTGPNRMAAAFLDITERKRAEQELRESEAMLNASQRVARVGHYVLDAASGRWSSSPALDEIFGIDAAFARDVDGWLAIVHPADREMMRDHFTREVLGERRPFGREYRIRRIGDGAERWVQGLGQLEVGPDGAVARMFGTIQDVTERKEAEAERVRLQQQMLHAQKLESLGVLAGGIAHDFNNILMSVIGHASLALQRVAREDPVAGHLRQIEAAADKAADLARQMLAYSGRGRFVVESVDLNQLVRELGDMIQVSISKKVAVRYELADPLPAVDADATQLRQVILNLVINASEAIGGASGAITLRTGFEECSRDCPATPWPEGKLPPGLYVTLEVADTGCGMEAETCRRLFEPFFSTKFAGRGLGMAAVLGIVRGHHGAITVASEPGRGATFRVFLPASGRQPVPRRAAEADADWRGGGTVLLVDDEPGVLATGAEMLRALGFTVVTAADGLEALRRLRAGPRPDLVVLDLTMPRMDGEQAFRELRALDPGLRVVMSSGYNETEISTRFAGKDIAGFIQKPYTLRVLRAALRRALA